MYYEYRWYYLTSILLLLGLGDFFYDIRPALNEIVDLHLLQQTLSAQITRTEQQHQFMPKIETIISDQNIQLAIVADLARLSHQDALQIKILHFIPVSEEYHDVVAVHLSMQGQYQAFYAFFVSMAQLRYPVLIIDFDFKTAHQQLSVEITCLVIKAISFSQRHSQFFLSLKYPFCGTFRPPRSEMAGNQLQLFSVKDMQMMGVLKRGEQNTAIILLPDNELIMVSPGAIIGKEDALVSNVSETAIEMVLANEHKFMLVK